MESKLTITQTPGNSPLKNVPSDYFPKERGFWFNLSEGLDANKKIFFRDSTQGNRDPEHTIVFIHGNPECSYTYRKIIKHLIFSAKKPFRIIAMDHVGFGLSDQASFEMVCMDHSHNLLQLINHLDLKHVTLVIHDWGGPIGIGAFLKAPERVSNLIILNSSVFPMPNNGITYANYPAPLFPWSKSPNIIPDRFWGTFAAFSIFSKPSHPLRLLINMIISIISNEFGIFFDDEKVAQKIFKEQFQSKSNIMSSKRLVLQTPTWGYGNTYIEPRIGKRDTTSFYRFIQENINVFWGPDGQNIGVRALCGKWDPLAKEEVIKQWVTQLPQLERHVKIYQNVGHFIEEVRSKEVAEAIIEVARLI